MRSPLKAAYDHFRLERQGDLVSPATLQHYGAMVGAVPDLGQRVLWSSR